MNIFRWFSRKEKTADLNFQQFQEQVEVIQNRIDAELYAEFVVVEFIAKAFSKMEIKFFKNNKPFYGEEYYRWNIKPNDFQSGTEFKKEIAARALIDGELLIFETPKHGIVVADSFEIKENGTSGYLFTNITKNGQKYLDVKSSSDVIYFNYESSEIKGRLRYLLGGLQDLITNAAELYEKNSKSKVILDIDTLKTGSKNFQENVDKLLNEQFSKFFNSKNNAVIPIYDGMKYHDINSNNSNKKSEVDDITKVINEMISKSAISHGVHPAMVIGDKENTIDAEKVTVSNAIKPIALNLVTAINANLFNKDDFAAGEYAKENLSPIVYSTIFDHADATDKSLASGMFSIDELREAKGERALNTSWSKAHWMTKNYQEITKIDSDEPKGGEK